MPVDDVMNIWTSAVHICGPNRYFGVLERTRVVVALQVSALSIRHSLEYQNTQAKIGLLAVIFVISLTQCLHFGFYSRA